MLVSVLGVRGGGRRKTIQSPSAHTILVYCSLPPVFREKSPSKRVRCCNHHTPVARLLFAARMGCMLHVGFVAALESRFATRSSAIDPSRPKRDIDSSSRARRWTGAKKGKREARATHVPAFLMRAVAPPPSVHASGKTRLYSGKHALTHRTRARPRTA